MPDGSQSPTRVTQVAIDSDGTIQVTYEVDAFMPGESVEISGYVAQDHGAFAAFNDFQKLNTKLGGTAVLTVPATLPLTSPAFQQGDEVIVFLRVSKVWVTVLGEGPVQQPGITPRLAGPGSVWGKLKGVAGPEDYSDTSEGNQPYSAAGGARQAASAGPSSSETG
jgi:hypothetical protein